MTRRGLRAGQPLLHLPLTLWPTADRDLFTRAFLKPNDIFSDIGTGYRWKPRTKSATCYGYCRWLGWIAAHHPHLLAKPPVDRISSALVREYVGHLRQTCSARTVAGYIRFLLDTARMMYPSLDLSWLKTIKARLERAIPQRGRAPILVTSQALIDASLARLDRVDLDFEGRGPDATSRHLRDLALRYRDGLLAAVATLFPLRRSNLADLMIGTTISRGESGWSISIPGELVKNGEPLDADLPHWIGERVDRFVEVYRPLIFRRTTHKGLWASAKGRPATGDALYNAFQKEVRASLAIHLALHDTRRIGGTTWVVHDPVNAAGAKDLIGDRSDRVFAQRYNLASGIQGTRAVARMIEELKSKG